MHVHDNMCVKYFMCVSVVMHVLVMLEGDLSMNLVISCPQHNNNMCVTQIINDKSC